MLLTGTLGTECCYLGCVEQYPAGQGRELVPGVTPAGFFAGTAPRPIYQTGAVICHKYRLDEMLGEGGMGSVWRAMNLQLDCPVALKLIRAGLDRPDLRLRLKLEARSAAKLAHPSIVRVFDVGESETGDPFIVMELLNGQILSQLSLDAPLSAVRSVQLLLPIAEALSVAHGSGIVHRDLKPDNVFIVEEDGRVQPKLLDFGIAKVTDNADRVGGLTQSGTLLGTPEYMSPEAARGQGNCDARADIWSFCVVLYEQVAGAMPFVADNPYAMLRAIIEDAPTPLPSQIAGAVELWDILQRGLAKHPCDRFQSMADLGRALALWLGSQGVHDDACGLSLDAKWLRCGNSQTPALADGPRGERELSHHRATSIAGRQSARRRQSRWLVATAVVAVALGGAWSIAGNARLPDRSAQLPVVNPTPAAVVPTIPAPLAPSAVVAEVPAPAVVKNVPPPAPAARRVPRSAVQHPNSPAAGNVPTERRGEARSASLDLIPPY